MKYFLIFLCVTVVSSCIKSSSDENVLNTNDEFKLPENWSDDFSIEMYEGGGMLYESSTVIFTNKICKYSLMKDGEDSVKTFTLTKEEQVDLLKQLKKFNVETIRVKKLEGIVNDCETSRICIHYNKDKEHCISTGATEQIEENDMKDFGAAYFYLNNLAFEKTK